MTATNDAKQAAAIQTAAATESKKPQKRQAVSGLFVTIILIGIVVTVGGIMYTMITDIVQTGLVLDAVEIKRLNIQNTGTSSYITGMVKNAGNTDITDVTVIVTLAPTVDTGTASGQDQDGVFITKFNPEDLNSGQTGTVNAQIWRDASDNALASLSASSTGSSSDSTQRLTIGEKYLVEIRATIAGGGEYSQTKILSPQ